jgi:hypothetical protein
MKIVFVLILLFFPAEIMCQLNLPKPAEVERIEISKTSMADWYKPEELLKLLPEFIASEGTYLTKAIPFQYGKFILKNGKELNWMANYTDSILLYDGKQEQLFVLPKKDEPIFRVWNKDGKEGFIDVYGKAVNITTNNAVGEFSEGLAPALIGDKWGYINRQGIVVIAPRWKSNEGWLPAVSPFHEGFAVVIEYASWGVIDDSNYWTYKCGYINTKGEYVIQPKLRQNCGTFSNGLARIQVDLEGDEYEKGKGDTGYMNAQGNWTIKPQFFQASQFSDGFALVQDDPTKKDAYLIDKTGRKIEGKKDCRWRYEFRENLALTYTKNNQIVFINEQCDEVFRLASDLATDAIYFIAKGYDGRGAYTASSYFSESLLVVYKVINGEKVFGYLDRTGKTAIDFKFADATPFFDGLAGVVIKEKDKKYNAYINRKGEIVLKNTRGIAPFYNGLAFHFLSLWTISERPDARNIYGYMNKQGKYVWLSPGAENYLDKDWIKENYIGAKLPERK